MSHANNKLMEKIGMRWGLLPLYALIYLVGMCFKKKKEKKKRKLLNLATFYLKATLFVHMLVIFIFIFSIKKFS